MFTHDTQAALLSAAALVNTLTDASDSGTDELATVDQLRTFSQKHEYSGEFRRDEEELDRVRGVRVLLRALWGLETGALVDRVNAMLRDHEALPQLVRHDGHGWHVHAVAGDRPLADRMVVETAMAVVDLVRADEQGRMRTCSADDCDAVFVDLSRNRSKRYCDVSNCANRAHVAAYRARRAEQDD